MQVTISSHVENMKADISFIIVWLMYTCKLIYMWAINF